MERAFNTPPIPESDTVPVMYQGASDDFLGPCDDVPLPAEADGIDFGGEFGVVCGPVTMGLGPEAALGCICLVVQINDWSLRALGPPEMKTGFGFLRAKPSTACACRCASTAEMQARSARSTSALCVRRWAERCRYWSPARRASSAGRSLRGWPATAGRLFVCPTSPGATTWASSLPNVVDNLIHAALIDVAAAAGPAPCRP